MPDRETMMARPFDVTSSDGVALRCQIEGDGPAVVLVHGSLGSKETFALLVPHLSEAYTVLTFDRRGRGESGDSSNYSIDREADDISAVVESVGDAVHLVAHSFGATSALVAVDRVPMPLLSLALYEPPSFVDHDPSLWASAVAHSELGDFEQAWLDFAPVAGVSEAEARNVMAFAPAWRQLCNAMPALGRELDALHECRIFERDTALPVSVPTTHIKGSETTGTSYVTTDVLRRLFPDIADTMLNGHGHAAAATGPEVLAQALRDHFARSS